MLASPAVPNNRSQAKVDDASLQAADPMQTEP